MPNGCKPSNWLVLIWDTKNFWDCIHKKYFSVFNIILSCNMYAIIILGDSSLFINDVWRIWLYGDSGNACQLLTNHIKKRSETLTWYASDTRSCRCKTSQSWEVCADASFFRARERSKCAGLSPTAVGRWLRHLKDVRLIIKIINWAM